MYTASGVTYGKGNTLTPRWNRNIPVISAFCMEWTHWNPWKFPPCRRIRRRKVNEGKKYDKTGNTLTVLLDKLTVTDAAKVPVYDPEQIQDGTGVVTAEIGRIEPMNPGLPDYRVTVSVMGQTFTADDPDREKFQTLAEECLRSIEAWTPAELAAAAGEAIVGKLLKGMDNSCDGNESRFKIDLELIISDWNF